MAALSESDDNLPQVKNEELPSMEPFSHETQQVETNMIRDDINISSAAELNMAPPLTFNKFLTMQDKRVVATIRYTEGLKPYYLTAAQKIKASHPDVVIEKRILPSISSGGSEAASDSKVFEVLVDEKLVVGNNPKRSRKGDGSVYVSMQEMDLAISKARRKRRPTTLYGEDPSNNAGVRLEMLRKSRTEEQVEVSGDIKAKSAKGHNKKWND